MYAITNPQPDYTETGVIVKGETEALEGIFFDEEEKIVERQVKRKLTPTPEEFAETEQDSKQTERSKALSRYYIRKALLDKLGRKYNGLYACPGCLERKRLRLYRVNKGNGSPKESDYILLCDPCIKKRKEEQKKTKLWTRGPGVRGGSPESKQACFLNSIRALVFERYGAECPYCGSKENLGLGVLRPLSRGGDLSCDNYSVACNKCRRAKDGGQFSIALPKQPMTPFEFIWHKISFKYYLTEQLDDEPVVKNPGVRIRVNIYLLAQVQQYLHKIAAGEEVDRSKAEWLSIKLSETDEDRKKDRREQTLW